MVDHHPGFPAGEDDSRILRKRPEELRPELHPMTERCVPEAGDFRARVSRLVAQGRMTGREHGTPAGDRWWTERNRDYSGDISLFWEAGTSTHEMRLTPGDIEQIRIQLSAAPPSPTTVIAWLAGMSAYLEADAQLLPCAADVADQAALERVIKLIRRHYLKEDV